MGRKWKISIVVITITRKNIFPFNYFVIIHFFSITLEDGQTISGNALVHMEKNWGDSFPSGWLWLQGVNAEEQKVPKSIDEELDQVSFAVTYGPVRFYVVDVPGHLGGFRHKAKVIT